MDDFSDFASSPAAPAEDAVSDFLAREAQMAQELGDASIIQEQPDDFFNTAEPVQQQSPLVIAETPKSAPVDKPVTVVSSTQPSPTKPADSEFILKWKENNQKEIQEKDRLEQEKQAENLAKAKKDIENFYAEYNQKKQKQIQSNRAESQAASEISGSTVWERVANQIEFGSKKQETTTKKKEDKKAEEQAPKKDTTRMKQLILSLKNDPKAPGITA